MGIRHLYYLPNQTCIRADEIQSKYNSTSNRGDSANGRISNLSWEFLIQPF